MTTTADRTGHLNVKEPVTVDRRVLLALVNAAEQYADELRERSAAADTTLERRQLMNRCSWIQVNANTAYDAAQAAAEGK